jgi:hypothetical protein
MLLVTPHTSSEESSGPSSAGPFPGSEASSSSWLVQAPTQSSAQMSVPLGSTEVPPRRQVGFQSRDFVSTYRNAPGMQCFRCGSPDHVVTYCLPGAVELLAPEQRRLKEEWLTQTGRTAATGPRVASTVAVEEDESDLESVDADGHIPGQNGREVAGMAARMARPATGSYDSESDSQGPQQGDWRWAFELGLAAARAGNADKGSGDRRWARAQTRSRCHRRRG